MRDDGVLRTMIVDDEPLAIERMQVLCAEIEPLQVVGTASDGEASAPSAWSGRSTVPSRGASALIARAANG